MSATTRESATDLLPLGSSPSPRSGPRPRALAALAAALAGLLAASLLILAPAALPETHPLPNAARVLGARVCHQAPSRTIHVAGRPLAVCSRCTGLLAGGAGSLVLLAALPLARRRGRPPAVPGARDGRPLAFALSALVAHVAWGALGLPDGGNPARLLAGAVAGAAFAPHLVAGLAGINLGRRRPARERS